MFTSARGKTQIYHVFLLLTAQWLSDFFWGGGGGGVVGGGEVNAFLGLKVNRLPHVFQTHKTFVHLRNTNEGILD